MGEAQGSGAVGGDTKDQGPIPLGMVADPIVLSVPTEESVPSMVADPVPSDAEGCVGHAWGQPPVMPHTVLSPEELDEQYPSLRAPEELSLHDYLRDEDDYVYMHGLDIAKEIQNDVDVNGRRRHMDVVNRMDQSELSSAVKENTLKPVDAPLKHRSFRRREDSKDTKLMSPIVGACCFSSANFSNSESEGIPPGCAISCRRHDRRRSARMKAFGEPAGSTRQPQSSRQTISATICLAPVFQQLQSASG